MDDRGTLQRASHSVLYLVISGAPAPEGISALITACQAAGWRVVVFSTPTGTRFVDATELEELTGDRCGPSTECQVPESRSRPQTRYWPAR